MSDIHDKKDNRNISISNVGVTDYYVPFIFTNSGEEYITISGITCGVSLNSETKGAHLSRINMVINEKIVNKKLCIDDLKEVTDLIAKEVGVNNANLTMKFKIAFDYTTPKSNLKSNLFSDIEIFLKSLDGKIVEESIEISANAAMLCPNSKAKSKYGAHSQKCILPSWQY